MEHDKPVTVYFVSRHPGAREWAATEGLAVDEFIPHLDITRVRAGDVAIGSLPVNLAAEVCAHGARYRHLLLDLPADARGMELTAEAMRRHGVRLEEFWVERAL
jgi:CRISPR-associated protein Csx16